MPEDSKTQIYVDTFFARQPIFDAAKKVFGYELLYRRSPLDSSAHYTDKDVATLSVISTALISNAGGEQDGKKILIHFSAESILSNVQFTLPPGSTVVEIEPAGDPGPDYLAALGNLKRGGYALAVNDYRGANCHPALVDLADMVFVNIQGLSGAQLAALSASLKGRRCLLAAKRVEDLASFELAKEHGFHLFQGFFFEKPIIIPGRKLASSKVSRLNIFRTLESEEVDVEELTEIIESDVAVSFRLLSFINSVSFGLRFKVESIRHAILLLGWKQVKSWLWLIVLSDVMPAEKTSELPYLSSIRAKFLERAAANHQIRDYQPETLFLLGLFSLLEPMLDTPMRELVAALPLQEGVKAALEGEQNGYRDWLDVARCFESGDWAALDQLTVKLSLDPIKVASSYCEALAWAKSLYEPQAQPSAASFNG